MQIKEMSADELIRVTTSYIIPFYQRNYTWGKSEIEELIQDVLENTSRHYYLGNIVIKTEHFDKIIVDGQQRITTLLLMVKAFTTFDELEEKYRMYFTQTLQSTYENETVVNFKTLEKIFKDIPLTSEEQDSIYFKNYKVILELLKDKDINEVVNQYFKIQFAYIGLDDDVDEHKVFSQINSTGKKLRAFDLMKNYLFSKIDESVLDVKLSELEIVTLGLSESEKDKMLRYFNAYKTGELVKNSVNDIYSAIKKIDETPIDLINQILEYCSAYRNLLKQDNLNINLPQILFDSFNSYSVVLVDVVLKNSVYSNGKTVIINESEIDKVFLVLENYKIRREFCSFRDKEITRYIPRLPKLIESKKELTYSEALVQILLVDANEAIKNNGYRMPTDLEFEKAFKTYPIYNNPKLTKSLLIRLETHHTREKTDFSNFSIEHVMPQTLTEYWLEQIDGDRYQHSNYLHTIGNLTLTADNSTLSNLSYEEKKEILKDKSRCTLNQYFNNIEKWNIEQIEQRATELFNIINEIWNIKS